MPLHRFFLATGSLAALAAAVLDHSFAAGGGAVGIWNFDGDLTDRSGKGNHAFAAGERMTPGRLSQGLRCDRDPASVPDTPELRPAPGLRLECWARIDDLGRSWQPLIIKDHAYQLRLDPPQEGSHFSFFLNLDGWEPRVSSSLAAQTGIWYHLAAGWDGREIWLEVDGQRVSRARKGSPLPSREPLEFGRFQGVLDEVRIENPQAPQAGTAAWFFDGNLQDSSGNGLHLQGKDPGFVPVSGGQALRAGPGGVQVPNRPELQLAPGLLIDCSVFFDQLPSETRPILVKDGEYQLRINSPQEGSLFAFFVNLNGWEPRVSSPEPARPGQWYRILAQWDGFALSLEVNGVRQRVTRSGLPKPTPNPLQAGGHRGLLDRLRIENPRLPTLEVRRSRQEHAILCAGRPERFTTSIRNVGAPSSQVAVQFELPQGVRALGDSTRQLGALSTGDERMLEWAVEAGSPILGAAEIRVTAQGAPPLVTRHPLVFFPDEEALPPAAAESLSATSQSPASAATYYVDPLEGQNQNSGTAPGAAWKDFTPINGRTLGPGEKLLIRRGTTLNQELTLSARGTPKCWAEIGAYGTGARPTIRRNWDIDERCALVLNPDFLRISGLVVCHAGKGLIVHYNEPGHRGLVIEDCIAHHIEGLYRHNSHGIPEWLDRRGPPGDSLHSSAGIATSGAKATGVILKNCETFQNSSGYFIQGDDALIDGVFCHDNIVHNTSPHPFVVGVRRTLLRNSIFDAAGWHASAGTMGVMLGDPQGLVIRNCVFRNQPDSGSHDEGGIDFENSGNGCLIDQCTFQNNAGAAIEVLGLKSPQTTNIEIRNSRFLKNNTANKLGPSEIFVWGRSRDASVCCSTGLIRNNGYVTLPGVDFFVNEAAQLTSWTLQDNTGYSSVEDLERARPFNRPPVVQAGPDRHTDQPQISLQGLVRDDGKPGNQPLAIAWELLEGPGPVTFAPATAAGTQASFPQPGDYTLRLTASDGEFWLSDMTVVHVLPPGSSVTSAWEFNTNLDQEGWSESNLGTQVRNWPNPDWPTTSHPVRHAAGGYWVLAIENSRDAHLLSPASLNLALTGSEHVVIRMQNHTPAKQMRLQFTTEAGSDWEASRSLTFPVEPNDSSSRTYVLNPSSLPGWKGKLRHLRLDLADGTPLTGTCRIDYIWITRQAPAP